MTHDASFADMLSVGGKSNSLGRVNEVIELILDEPGRLEELYICVLANDAWVRMRAIDAFEKICRQHPEWIAPYIDRISRELASSTQPSIQWHLAQIYAQVALTEKQKMFVIKWLKQLLATADIDWIVAANSMHTLTQFTLDGSIDKIETNKLLGIQTHHNSPAVIKRANKLLDKLNA